MKLYKTDSKRKQRIWYAEAVHDKLIVHHGVDGGSIITEETICQPKNLGRSNEVTAEEQAVRELVALYKKKLNRDGYTLTPGETVSYIQPMLARDYKEVGHQVDWNKKTYGSAKLDGVRAIWTKDQGFQSRKGTFYNVEHLTQKLKNIDLKLDGEIYVHGQPLNRIVSAAKKPNALTPSLEFRVFDAVLDGTYDQRLSEIYAVVSRLNDPMIQVVKQREIKNEKAMLYHHQQFVAQGYEGIMIRQDGPYVQGSRSPHLFKYKEFKEKEFEIIGVKSDKHNQAVMQCDGFDVRMRGTDQEREFQLQHPEEFIGKLVTVRYFALTEYGVPQFPVGVTIREDL